MAKTRGQKFRLIWRFLLKNIGMEDILAGLPGLAMALASLWLAIAFFNDQAFASKYASLGYWPVYEMASVLIFQYMLYVFDPSPKEGAENPVWLRVGSLFAVSLFMFGLKASFFIFSKIFVYFWPFILAKAVSLYLRRPSEKDRSVGCLGAVLGLAALVLLCGAVFALEAGPAWYLLAGFPYFALLGSYEMISEPLYKLPDYGYWDFNEE